MKIEIKKLTDSEKKEKGISNWPIWEKEISKFDWFYDSAEHCLILEGQVFVKTDFETAEINAGDYVIFPKGLKCVWDIKKPIKKHYFFE
jgi:uncharacterized cupin superfamily protein